MSSDASATPESTPPPSSTRPPRIAIRSRRTVVLLHPTVIRRLLNRKEVSRKQCEAWAKGTRAPGYQRSVKIAVSKAVIPAGHDGSEIDKTDIAALYAKSLRWWLEG